MLAAKTTPIIARCPTSQADLVRLGGRGAEQQLDQQNCSARVP
jgi:hypothetical protein